MMMVSSSGSVDVVVQHIRSPGQSLLMSVVAIHKTMRTITMYFKHDMELD
jgi:hypothetical protein